MYVTRVQENVKKKKKHKTQNLFIAKSGKIRFYIWKGIRTEQETHHPELQSSYTASYRTGAGNRISFSQLYFQRKTTSNFSGGTKSGDISREDCFNLGKYKIRLVHL